MFGNSRIYGYDYVDKRLVINEQEAVFVRDLFETFATGNFSLNQLEKLFYVKGYRNTQGGRINHAAMAQVIRNPKYKGWFCGGKTTIADPFDQRQIRLPEEEWIMYPDENIPALVSEETWAKANAILAGRSADVKSHRGQYTYGRIREDIGKILRKLCEMKKVELIEGELCKDHVHLLVSIPPHISVSEFVGYLKGKSSLMIFDKHANLKYKYGNRHFWCRGYYVK